MPPTTTTTTCLHHNRFLTSRVRLSRPPTRSRVSSSSPAHPRRRLTRRTRLRSCSRQTAPALPAYPLLSQCGLCAKIVEGAALGRRKASGLFSELMKRCVDSFTRAILSPLFLSTALGGVHAVISSLSSVSPRCPIRSLSIISVGVGVFMPQLYAFAFERHLALDLRSGEDLDFDLIQLPPSVCLTSLTYCSIVA